MSCENPPGSTEAVMPRRRKFDKSGICIKCKTERGRLVIRHAVYCKACFLTLVTSKFRRVLDPTINSLEGKPLQRGALKASGNLMIGFSGGLGSTVLLDLVQACYCSSEETGRSKGGKKHPRKSGKVWDRVIVCYIDCSEAYSGANDRTQDVKAILEKYKGLFDSHLLRLEDAFKLSLLHGTPHVNADMSREDLPVSSSPSIGLSSKDLLKSYLAALPTATSHESSITSLTRLLLQYAAGTHGCSHLLLGTSLTSLSVNLIDAVASGAGFTVGMEKVEEWQCGGNSSEIVRIVRPLREISMKECAAYMRWRDITVVGNERMLSGPVNVKESIGALTKEFIFGLERDYPSTVSAIVRTCDKLVSNTEGKKCVLCERPVQASVREWKERISIRKMPSNGTNSAYATEDAEVLANDVESLAPWLCYSCHTTLTSRSSRGTRRVAGIGDSTQYVKLPDWVGKNMKAGEEQRHGVMSEQVQEFLLDDDDT